MKHDCTFKHDYAFTFLYREVKNGEHKTERFIISSYDSDIENACTIAMLQFVKKNNYYSAILTTATELYLDNLD